MPVLDRNRRIVVPAGCTEWNGEGTATGPDAGAKETRELIENGWPL